MEHGQPQSSTTGIFSGNGQSTKPTLLGTGWRLIFPCIMLLIGLIYVHSCPAEKSIPVYLIVGGLMVIVSIAMTTVLECVYDGEDAPPVLKFMTYAVHVFNLIWFITGSVWTYKAFKPEYDNEKAPNYCSIYMYTFSFTYFTVVYVLTGLLLLALIYKMIFPGTVIRINWTDDSVVTAEPSTAVESIVGTVGCTIVTALVIALPIAMIVIEWGTMTLARKCAFLLSIDISGNDEKKSTEQYNAVKYSTLDLLIGWWPLIGGILVFEIYKPDYENKFSENYCHYTLYSFSFILVTMAIFAISILKDKFCVAQLQQYKTLGSVAVIENQQSETRTKKVKDAQENSSGCIDFCFGFFVIIFGTVRLTFSVGCTILSVLLIGIPVAMIVIGAIHRKNCQASPHIPIWLIQFGVLTLARKCAFILSIEKSDKDQAKSGVYSTLDLLIGWWPLIVINYATRDQIVVGKLGAVLVFEISTPEFENKLSENYCHKTLFTFSLCIVGFAIGTLILTAIGKMYKFCKYCISEIRDKKSAGAQNTDVEASEQVAMT
uniref:Uncharacterized protein n=1 Tax=Strigamia maritima TaxID=126957 RepID=T1IPP4_STRMM